MKKDKKKDVKRQDKKFIEEKDLKKVVGGATFESGANALSKQPKK